MDTDVELTDEVVDAWLKAHKDDPVNEAQVERVRKRFFERLAEEQNEEHRT